MRKLTKNQCREICESYAEIVAEAFETTPPAIVSGSLSKELQTKTKTVWTRYGPAECNISAGKDSVHAYFRFLGDAVDSAIADGWLPRSHGSGKDNFLIGYWSNESDPWQHALDLLRTLSARFCQLMPEDPAEAGNLAALFCQRDRVDRDRHEFALYWERFHPSMEERGKAHFYSAMGGFSTEKTAILRSH